MSTVFQPSWADLAPDAVILSTEDGTVLQWAGGAETLYGYTHAAALGATIDELIVVPEDQAEQTQRLETVLAHGTLTFETIRRCRDGTLIYVDVSARCIATGNDERGISLLWIEKDVTALRVRRDGRLLSARYHDLLESTPDGIVLADRTGHVVIANSHAEHLFGYAPGELDGQPVEMLLPERLRSMHVSHRAHYRAQPHPRPMGAGIELAARRRDGSEFPVEISLSPLATEVGPMTMSAIRDVTERKRFEKALQEKNHELAAANQAKTQFLASMSHELRTPLNAIIGFTGALLMKLSGPLTSVQEEQLKLVQSSGKHLLALIGDLLDLARIEAGRIDLTPEPIDAITIINEVVASLRPQAAHKGLALNVAHEAPALALHADRRALTQILINLIGNAIKFTERGHVHVHSERAFGSDGRALVRIAIEDTGLGIRPEEQAQLFEAFARGLVAKRAGIEGTGLGLHLSRKLTLLLGGNLSLRSEFGSGSTFTLELPADPAAG